MGTPTKAKEGNESSSDASITYTIKAKETNENGIELTSGWVYDGTSMKSDTGEKQINIGFVNTYYAQAMTKENLTGTKIKTHHFLAITILHMMGHTSGLNHIDKNGKTGVNEDGRAFNLMSGEKRLKDYLRQAKTYEAAVHGNKTMGHTLWRMFVQSYFSSSIWNGNPNTEIPSINFAEANLRILQYAIKSEFVKI